jgi:serine/threonine-protein kinase
MTAATPGKGGRGRLGKYEVLAHLATGGMGAVYKARDTVSGRTVALKVLSPEMAANPALRERFRREARSAAKLRHANIVAIYECGEVNGLSYLALEYVDGTDLHHHITRDGPLPTGAARAVLLQAARALAHLHSQGIVHRDVKPSNFLVARRGGRLVVKLTDLGLAREPTDADQRVTRLGSTVGTLDYMSPEQARDSGSADIRSDLYSLGCTLYHVLAGRCPFTEGGVADRVRQHAEEEPADIRQLRPEVPADLAAVLHRLLRKQPADRFQTPQEVLDALGDAPDAEDSADPEEVATNEPTGAAPTATLPVKTARRAPPRRPVPLRAATTTALKARIKRLREPETQPAPAPGRAAAGRAGWWPQAVAAAMLVAVACVVGAVLLFPPADGTPADDQDTAAAPQKEREPDGQEPEAKEPAVKPVEPIKKVAAVEKAIEKAAKQAATKPLPRVFQPEAPLDPVALRREFAGPLADFPEPARDAVVLRVGRGAGAHPTLADAWKHLPADRPAIIEIHDDGPLAVGPLPALVQRRVLLRAGAGHRPLLVWELGDGPARVLLPVHGGELLLDGLDVVFTGAAAVGEPAELCRVTDGAFGARNCSFTCAAESARALTVVRLQGAARARLVRCFGRGDDLTALRVTGAGAEAMLDGCLFVTGAAPLLDVAGPDQAPVTLRAVRSTLVAGKTLLRLRPEVGRDGLPRLQWFGWDALLTCSDAERPGDLVNLPTVADEDKVNWRAMNCVYAGWYGLNEGPFSRLLPDAWPNAAAPLDAVAPQFFNPVETSVGFAASAGGAVGCELERVPRGRGR